MLIFNYLFVTIHNIVYCIVYFVLKGRELKERESGGLYLRHNFKFGSWGWLRMGQHFYVFPYNRGFQERNPRVIGGPTVYFVQIQFADLAHCLLRSYSPTLSGKSGGQVWTCGRGLTITRMPCVENCIVYHERFIFSDA